MRLDENQKRVFNEFRLNKRASKADVSLKVNLTHPAVTQIVRKLCESGYLKEDEEKRKGPRGQPATIFAKISSPARSEGKGLVAGSVGATRRTRHGSPIPYTRAPPRSLTNPLPTFFRVSP